jgi:rod shape-determining protein MreC
VAGFTAAGRRTHYGRAPAAGLRFFVYAVIAILLMYLDQRRGWSQQLRYGLQGAAYPVQIVVSSPQRVWQWLRESSATRAGLKADNARLTESARNLQLAQLRLQALEAENRQLRELKSSLPPLVSHQLLAEVISVETNPLRQRLIINKGRRDGVFRNQVAVDAHGIIGQVTNVGPWSSEVILISDPEHALPVQVLRNQLRSVAEGSGRSGELVLPFLAVNSDVKAGDVLVTSGLGGVFPAGYPVARVTGVVREPEQLVAQVRAVPLAQLKDAREILLIQFNAANPAAPAAEALISSASSAPMDDTP